MFGTLRAAIALASVAALTGPLMIYQYVAVRTGWTDERRAPKMWHGIVLRILGFRVRTFGRMAGQKPLLVVANHVSWTDIMVLGSVAELHFIAKSEMARWPVFGTLARLQRSVFVERDQKRRSAGQAAEIAERMAAGDRMVLFAEGTTGDGNAVLPFKSSLFGAATLALERSREVWVQPVAIAYTRLQGLPMGRQHRIHAAWIGDTDLAPHLWALLRGNAMDVEVHLGEPVLFDQATDRKVFARDMEARVQAMLARALRAPAGPGR